MINNIIIIFLFFLSVLLNFCRLLLVDCYFDGSPWLPVEYVCSAEFKPLPRSGAVPARRIIIAAGATCICVAVAVAAVGHQQSAPVELAHLVVVVAVALVATCVTRRRCALLQYQGAMAVRVAVGSAVLLLLVLLQQRRTVS